MWEIEELKNHREIIDRIDWEMTPETAVETFLEWGTGWSRKGGFVQRAGQESLYFVIYDWEEPLRVTLIKRDMEGAEEIARIEAPEEMIRRAVEAGGRKPGVGVVAITEELEQWLRSALDC